MPRVHNLTDVPTPALRTAKLVNVPITMSGVTIQPGESAMVGRPPARQSTRLTRVGAIHIGEKAPPGYTPAPKAEKASVPRQTLGVQTNVEVKDSVSTTKKSKDKGKAEGKG